MAFLAIGRKNSKSGSEEVIQLEPLADIDPNVVLIHSSAAARIRHLLDEQEPEGIMRVGIVGGGCSGFSYHFAIEKAPGAKDLIFEGEQGVRICVDPKSLKWIGGSMLEWRDNMKRSGFSLRSKHHVKSCSCGQSFSV